MAHDVWISTWYQSRLAMLGSDPSPFFDKFPSMFPFVFRSIYLRRDLFPIRLLLRHRERRFSTKFVRRFPISVQIRSDLKCSDELRRFLIHCVRCFRINCLFQFLVLRDGTRSNQWMNPSTSICSGADTNLLSLSIALSSEILLLPLLSNFSKIVLVILHSESADAEAELGNLRAYEELDRGFVFSVSVKICRSSGISFQSRSDVQLMIWFVQILSISSALYLLYESVLAKSFDGISCVLHHLELREVICWNSSALHVFSNYSLCLPSFSSVSVPLIDLVLLQNSSEFLFCVWIVEYSLSSFVFGVLDISVWFELVSLACDAWGYSDTLCFVFGFMQVIWICFVFFQLDTGLVETLCLVSLLFSEFGGRLFLDMCFVGAGWCGPCFGCHWLFHGVCFGFVVGLSTTFWDMMLFCSANFWMHLFVDLVCGLGLGATCVHALILQLLYYEDKADALKGTISLDKSLSIDNSSISLHNDKQDCYIDICSLEVLTLFTDNLDYQHLRRHFVKGILVDDIMAYKIFNHEIHSSYAARVDNYRRYATISKDIIQRWTYPLVPDVQFSINCVTKHDRQGAYRASDVEMSRSAKIGPFTVIGSGTAIGNDTVIIGRGFIVPAYSKVSLHQQTLKQDSDEELEYADNSGNVVFESTFDTPEKSEEEMKTNLSDSEMQAA